MKEAFLYFLQNLLIIDGLILLLWLFDRKFHWKMGHLWRKILWLIICVRMLVPLEYHLSDFHEQWNGVRLEIQVKTNDTTSKTQEINETSLQNGIQIYEPVRKPESIIKENLQGESVDSTETSQSQTPWNILKEYWYFVLLIIWIIGFMLTLFYHILQYYIVKEFYFEEAYLCTNSKIIAIAEKICKQYRIRWKPKLYMKEQAATPMTFGYFCRKLIFPPNVYDESEIVLILQHEITHIKFYDAWYKTFLLFLCDLYWFNPVFLLMKRMAYRDVEYVCDEYVTKQMSGEEKKTYGTVILKTAIGKPSKQVPSVVQLSCSQKELKRRLHNLFEFKQWRLGFIPLLVSVIVVILLVTGVSITIKEIPAKIQISDGAAADPIADTFYTDNLEALNCQKDIESSYITDRYNGMNHYYIDESRTLWGTGYNHNWQLGIIDSQYLNSLEQIKEPVKIAENVIHVDVNCNSDFMIYLTEKGDLYGLGANLGGILRIPFSEEVLYDPTGGLAREPQLIMSDVAFASAGQECISVLTKDGKVWWWGEMRATCGTTGTGDMYSEGPMLMLENARYTVCGLDTAAAIDQQNNLWLWGCNVWGQCGLEGNDYRTEPYLAATDVEMVWPEYLTARQNIYDVDLWWGINPYLNTAEEQIVSYTYNTFIRKTDGKMYACGIDLGHYVKSVVYYGDLFIDGTDKPENYTHDYSPDFIEISVEETKIKTPDF